MKPWAYLTFALLGACSHNNALKPVDAKIAATDGTSALFRDYLGRVPWTVLVFISADCPCVALHEARLKELSLAYRAQGVQFLMVDSEAGSTEESTKRMAKERTYPFPILLDGGATLANAYGAEYATYTVILDRAGNVRYRGGIDSDRHQLHEDSQLFVRDAINDLLAGRNPRRPEARTLGCVLRKW